VLDARYIIAIHCLEAALKVAPLADMKEKISNGEVTTSEEYRDVETSIGKIDTYEMYVSPEGGGDISEKRTGFVSSTILYLSIIVLVTVFQNLKVSVCGI